MTRAKRTEKLSIRARAQGVGKRTGRGSKAPNPAQRVLDDLKKLVEEATGRTTNRQAGSKKTAGERVRNARRRQAEAKKTAAGRRRAKSR